ncbi:hypothetical protein ACRQ1B_06610 [Rhizobium panacihumi]|uniref:hypothetical protein n=1 Tax=Rhizobium panacihumi TaxID=2008450 RepID=UPI003D7BC75C
MTFDALEIGTTASRLEFLSKQFEEKAIAIRDTIDLHDAIPTPIQANWLEFLVNYSRTLKFYSDEAIRISGMEG